MSACTVHTSLTTISSSRRNVGYEHLSVHTVCDPRHFVTLRKSNISYNSLINEFMDRFSLALKKTQIGSVDLQI